MARLFRQAVWLILCAAALLPLAANAQVPLPRPQAAPVTNVTVDGNEAMFTTMCALLAAGFEADVSADNWQPFRAQIRDRMQHQQGPAVDALREFYHQHETMDAGQMLSRYIWFGLVSGPAPKFVPVLRRDELPPEVLALEGFSEILSGYYKEQNIGQVWRQVQPVYNGEIERLHESVSQIVFLAAGYLREIQDPSNPRTFKIVVEPLVGRITNVRNFGDHYSIVLSGSNDIPSDVIRHAYLHFLLDPLPLQYPHVVAVKRTLYEQAAHAPRLAADLKDDFSSYFAECTVRAVELKLKRMSPGERQALMDRDDAGGYVLVRPLFLALANFEKSEPAMKYYFPEMVRAIDTAAEARRIETVKFSPGESAEKADDPASEELVRLRRAVPTTVPNDPEAIAALTEGERRIAEKSPRAAEASFQKVLAKYPEQPRAWYGLGLVALMEHDGARAKQVFGRLTTGEHAAVQDPLVLAWSHVYLARIYDDEGQAQLAKTEYQAALGVDGGPEQARQAAQKGLAASAAQKPVERP
ncbi:MAG: tetratricopeptide repeat protein [Candidatus Acidiferrales bacterium]